MYYDENVFLKGISLSGTFEKSIFFLFQSMVLLSEDIVAKFYRIVLMVEFRAVALRKLTFHRLKTLKRVFSKPHFSKLRARLKKNH